MTTEIPDLWTDWCSVTGVPADEIDKKALQRFERQTGAPKTVISALLRTLEPGVTAAPAWLCQHRRDQWSLQRLIQRATVMVQEPSTHWVFRLRLKRMLFAAVLLAPASHGGLGLDRAGALGLRPDGLKQLRSKIGVAENPTSCLCNVVVARGAGH